MLKSSNLQALGSLHKAHLVTCMLTVWNSSERFLIGTAWTIFCAVENRHVTMASALLHQTHLYLDTKLGFLAAPVLPAACCGTGSEPSGPGLLTSLPLLTNPAQHNKSTRGKLSMQSL